MFEFIIGVVVGGVGIGVLARNKPEWFGRVADAVDKIDDKVNEEVAKAKSDS